MPLTSENKKFLQKNSKAWPLVLRKIKAFMEEHRLKKQKDLAKKLGITGSAVSLVLKEKRNPGPLLDKIEECFPSEDANSFVAGIDEEEIKIFWNEMAIEKSKERKDLERIFFELAKNLPPEKVQKLKNIIELFNAASQLNDTLLKQVTRMLIQDTEPS